MPFIKDRVEKEKLRGAARIEGKPTAQDRA